MIVSATLRSPNRFQLKVGDGSPGAGPITGREGVIKGSPYSITERRVP